MKNVPFKLLLAGVAIGALTVPAFAAEDDASAADQAPPLPLAEEDAAAGAPIVVTARRRQEDAQDVPIALSVVSEAQLAATGNYQLGQIQQLVPSLQVFSFNPRNTNVNIRGLGSNVALTNDGLDNGVGFYIDNVFYGRVGQSQFDLVDLQQIEVLRGPQGTLFGKNTTSGAINISTRLPSFDPEFRGEVSLGNFGYHQVRFSASGPITDTLAIRISAADTYRDGFLTNRFDNSDAQNYGNTSIRGQLLYQPSDAFSVRIIGDYSRQEQDYVLNVLGGTFTNYDNGAPIANSFTDRITRFGYTPPSTNPFDRIGDSDANYQSDMKSYGVSGEINWDLGSVNLTSVTAYRWWDWRPGNDGDGTSLPVLTFAQQANDLEQFSQELRLASEGVNTIDWVAGLYYYWQLNYGRGKSGYGPDAAGWLLPTTPAVVANAALNGFIAESTSTPEVHSYAAFGQATWNVSDAFKVTLGLRYTHEKKEGAFEQFWTAGVDLSGVPDAVRNGATAIRTQFNPIRTAATTFTSFEDDSLSGLLNASYNITPDALVYASYSRGSKSGGLNLTTLPVGVDPNVDPEKVDAYELGFKSQFDDGRITLNLAGFWIDTKDYQTSIVEQVQNTVNFRQYIANIPAVRSRGVEADLAWAPTDLIRFSASAAYTDATYEDFQNAPQAPENLNLSGVQDLSGERLAGVPKFTYTLGGDAAQPIGNWGGREVQFYGHADFSHRSSFNTSATNSRYAQIPGYGILNARIGLRDEEGRWDIAIFARNLLDEDYFNSLSANAAGSINALVGEPRTYGVTLKTSI